MGAASQSPREAVWQGAHDDVRWAFLGRPSGLPESGPERLAARADAAWCRQIHSRIVLEALEPGLQGEGDALFSSRTELALTVVTADCVPILIAGPTLAAVHAGWRGLEQGVIAATMERLSEAGGRPHRAWIGPCIRSCCYEVGRDVADAVAAATGSEAVIIEQDAQRPHLDLAGAAERQLRSAGLEQVERIGPCTACSPRLLHSYRRDGAKEGRNLALVWRHREPAPYGARP